MKISDKIEYSSFFLDRYKRYVIAIFFLVFLGIGLVVYKDYGISYDEPLQRGLGGYTYNYITQGDRNLFLALNRYHGPIYQLLLTTLEGKFNLTLDNERGIYEMRHLVNFIFFYVACVFYFLLSRNLLQNWKVALFGTAMLIVTPRLFAHAFFNPKDLIFLDLFVIAVYFAHRLWTSESISSAIKLGLVSGLLTSVRVLGILMPGLLIIHLIFFRSGKLKLRQLAVYGVFFLVYLATIYLSWPLLWEDPVNNFTSAVSTMSRFPYESKEVFFGREVLSTNLPWYYVPGWILITTPIAYLVMFLAGSFSAVLRKRSLNEFFPFIFSWFGVPIVSVIGFGSTLYSGYRHLYFTYPALLIIAQYGLINLMRVKRACVRYIAIILIVFNFVSTALFMIKYHPLQNVYFNILAGSRDSIQGDFPLDYWGASYKQALEYLDSYVPEGKIYIAAGSGFPAGSNTVMQRDRTRFVLVDDIAEAEFYVTAYENDRSQDLRSRYEELYVRSVDGYEVIGVYSLK